MNQDILLSKIVPTPTDTAWAQAYTTLNVYITLSIENEQSKIPVTSFGKDLLEKLQREFFALDEKSLDNIKNAVHNVSKTISEEYTYSILVGAIVENILYIVIASDGQVVIRRGDKTGIIAKGIDKELHGFSGKLTHDDIVVLQTGDFARKIPLDSLTEYLSSADVLKIAEDITPLTHEGAKGTESAIILQFKNFHTTANSSLEENGEETDAEDEEFTMGENAAEDVGKQNLWETAKHENRNIEELSGEENYEKPQKKGLIPSISLPKINFANRKIILACAVGILALLLVGGVLYQSSRQNQAQKEAEFAKVYDPAKEQFDAGVSLSGLNATLALEDLNKAIEMVNNALKDFDEGSEEHSRLAELKSQIENKISELGGGGSAKNITEFLKPSGDLKSINAISARAGEIVILDRDGEQVVAVGNDGDINDTYDISSKDSHIASDDRFIYTMGASITRIDKGNGNVTKVLEEAEGKALDVFGSNFYILNGNEILKYRAPSESSTDYFTDDPGFSSTPTHMSISGSVFVLEQNGTLSRFTRGKRDDFEVSGLKAPIGEGAMVYADPDNSNIYVMDIKNQRVVVLNEEGAYEKQYEGNFIKNATSFAIDESNKKGYVVASNTVTSFDL